MAEKTPTRRTAERRTQSRAPDQLVIECVSPELDGGRYPVKRTIGDRVVISADIFKEGHDVLGARVLVKGPGDKTWTARPLTFDFDSDRWYTDIDVDRLGTWTYTVEAWTDLFSTWRRDLQKKVEAGQDVHLELLEGAQLVRQAARRAKFGAGRATLLQTASVLEERRELSSAVRTHRALDEDLPALMAEHWSPRDVTRYSRELKIYVDRKEARFSSWYEFFPRSTGGFEDSVKGGADPSASPQDDKGASPQDAVTQAPQRLRHGTFDTSIDHLPRIAQMGFDVVYLPPIHPIGKAFRKGRNNTLTPGPTDVGSPWAIGSEEGGHDAVAPELGGIESFDRFVKAAKELGIEVALDYALQCSPDHPWVKEHPDWFIIRPDGSIKYAENPPKKYQDIYPIDFWCEDREGLWNACRDVLLYWVSHGVTIFRVDNPHTKAWAFWEWVIEEVQKQHPETVFFAEAFTRPKRMKSLGKLGFSMSYTHYTWKNTAAELQEYLEELTQGPSAEYFRGNLFANTPDILNEYLVHGGRPAFRVRLLLAGTLLPLYGIYSGFELSENVPVKPGSEEYLDSEKYELKWRDYEGAGNLNPEIRILNETRRKARALQRYRNLTFHTSENPQVLFYRKAGGEGVVRTEHVTPELPAMPGSLPRFLTSGPRQPTTVRMPQEVEATWGDDTADYLVAVNVDPLNAQATMVHVPLEEMGIPEDEPYVVHDVLTGARYTWRGRRNYVRLDPAIQAGHLLRVEGR